MKSKVLLSTPIHVEQGVGRVLVGRGLGRELVIRLQPFKYWPAQILTGTVHHVNFLPGEVTYIPDVERAGVARRWVGVAGVGLQTHPEWLAQTQGPHLRAGVIRGGGIVVWVAGNTCARQRVDTQDFAVQTVNHLRPIGSNVFLGPDNAIGQRLRVISGGVAARIGVGPRSSVARANQQGAIGAKHQGPRYVAGPGGCHPGCFGGPYQNLTAGGVHGVAAPGT